MRAWSLRAAAASLEQPGRGRGGGRRRAPGKAALPGGVAETVPAQRLLLVTRPLATALALRPSSRLRPLACSRCRGAGGGTATTVLTVRVARCSC